MKFIASKKLSDNKTLRLVIGWMLITLILSMGLNLIAKGIDFGSSPEAWVSTVMGNPDEFIDPMLWSDLLLSVHTDLFGLIITFILIASLYVRTSRPNVIKISLFASMLFALLLYPIALLLANVAGPFAVTASMIGFVLFHVEAIVMSLDLLIALWRKRL